MDYNELAAELMQKMYVLRQAQPQKQIDESMQGEHFVLHLLSFHQRSVLPSEISNRMGISSARIAAALNSLERKGLVTRQIDISDRRRILVDLTPEGKALADKQHQKAMETLTNTLRQLGEHDAAEYVRITGKLAELASKYKAAE
jgi:Transcriptional regulators